MSTKANSVTLGPKGCRLRRLLGLAVLGMALLFVIVIDPVVLGPVWAAFGVFLLTTTGTILVYQAQTGT